MALGVGKEDLEGVRVACPVGRVAVGVAVMVAGALRVGVAGAEAEAVGVAVPLALAVGRRVGGLLGREVSEARGEVLLEGVGLLACVCRALRVKEGEGVAEPLGKGEWEVPGEALCVPVACEEALSVLVAVAPTALPVPCAVPCAELVEDSVSWLLEEGVRLPPALALELLLGAAEGEAETLREGEGEEEALAEEVGGALGEAVELAVGRAEALSSSDAEGRGVAVTEAVKVSLPLAAAETEAEGVA